MDIARFDSSPLPRVQNLAHSLPEQSKTCRNRFAAPPEQKVKLNHASLEIGAIMPLEYRNLARERHQIVPDCEPKLIRPQALQLYRIKLRQGFVALSATGHPASASFLANRLHKQHQLSVRRKP